MKEGDLESCAAIAIKAALEGGASAADAMVGAGISLSAGVRLGTTEKIKHSREKCIGVRVFVGRRSAVSSSADLEAASIRDLAVETVRHARLAQHDSFAGLPDSGLLAAHKPDLNLHDNTADDFPPAQAVSLAAAAEEAALSSDPRITNSEGAEFEVNSGRVIYASSDGFRGTYPTSSFCLSVIPVASSEGQMQRDWWYSTSRHFADLDPPNEVGAKAAARTLRRLGARQVPTQQVPVVLEPQVAGSLLGHLSAAVSGTALQRHASFLLDKLDQQVAAPGVTVIDDGQRPGALASRPFDAEGLCTRRNLVIEEGTLKSYLLDSYCARKLGQQPTGSAFRAVGGLPAPGSSNFYLMPGRSSPAEIITSVSSGLLVTELIGMGVNLVTGDYSQGATGQWIEHGAVAFPVEQITIAGNLLEMLETIEMIGDDLVFDRATCSPTIKLARLTVAGT